MTPLPRLHAIILALFTLSLTVLAVTAGCADDVETGPSDGDECDPGQSWDPIQGCVVDSDDPSSDNGDDDNDDDGNDDDDNANDNGDDVNGSDYQPDCEGLECTQVSCNPGETPASISGTVTIPSGNLPLPDVTVYVPADLPLEETTEGASCEQCGDQLSGIPLVETQTDLSGEFFLVDVPVGQEIPLVIEVGKWRRQVTIDTVEPCQDNPIEDESLTRLPSNTDEGEIPRIAVTTGGWDAMECLVRKIGVDVSEFSTEQGDGRIHLLAGRGGTDAFADFLNAGQSFTDAWDWWDDVDNLLDYDIVIHSCEGGPNPEDKSQQAREALQEFTELGGRAFLSHWHNIWLEEGPSDFQSVADWSGGGLTNDSQTGYINTEFDKGEMLYDWMYETGTTPAGEFDINEARATVGNLDSDIAQEWSWIESSGFLGSGDHTQQFSFNTPVGVDEDEQCGRVVFSEFHVVDGDNSSPSDPFPTGCTTDELTDQEKALVFLLFDLSRCITPDGKKPPQ